MMKLHFKNEIAGVCMFGRRIYGCEKPEVKRGVTSPIDFLCKIEISRFYSMPLINKTLFTDENYIIINGFGEPEGRVSK